MHAPTYVPPTDPPVIHAHGAMPAAVTWAMLSRQYVQFGMHSREPLEWTRTSVPNMSTSTFTVGCARSSGNRSAKSEAPAHIDTVPWCTGGGEKPSEFEEPTTLMTWVAAAAVMHNSVLACMANMVGKATSTCYHCSNTHDDTLRTGDVVLLCRLASLNNCQTAEPLQLERAERYINLFSMNTWRGNNMTTR